MQPIKRLTTPEYITIKNQVEVLVEQLQNHHIAVAMDGTNSLDYLETTRASELVLRAFKVAMSNGTSSYPNIVYMVDKLKQALEYLSYHEQQ